MLQICNAKILLNKGESVGVGLMILFSDVVDNYLLFCESN